METVTHLIVLYWCDRADRSRLHATPPIDNKSHGVFATRSPNRPNPIALDIARLVERKENKLIVSGMDALDGSPILDLKPYSPEIDCILDARVGWREKIKEKE